MRLALLLALLQSPAARTATPDAEAVRRAEHERRADVAFWQGALAAPDTQVRRLAARAVGRLERADVGALLVPVLADPVVAVRREAAWAIGQARVTHDLVGAAAAEPSPVVRAMLLEAMGRVATTPGAVRATLVTAIADPSPVVAAGAARGLLAQLRRVPRSAVDPLPPEERGAIERAAIASGDATVRALLLRVLATPGVRDRHGALVRVALRDTSAEVRRAGVALASREATPQDGTLDSMAVHDPVPAVRIAALERGARCDRFARAFRDPAPHVVTVAIAGYGARALACDPAPLDSLARGAQSWRVRGQALHALAGRDPGRARDALAPARASSTWQLRAWAARAAVLAGDTVAVHALARDAEPNVVVEALALRTDATRAAAYRALGPDRTDHAGLVLAAAARLAGEPALRDSAIVLLEALARLTRRADAVTWRDARVALLARLREAGDTALVARVRPFEGDADPAVALAAARITGADTAAIARRALPVPPFPDARARAALAGVHLVLTLRDLGDVELALLVDEAPATVATVVQLARHGGYAGRTLHRVVPAFVLQGGSPGADEYDPATAFFMRDEVGGRHDRGTWGISTRGRDTGDGQLFVNLVDNGRLDHDYTVFARTVRGAALLDRVEEGTVIERVRVVPRR
jgi:cyclophilin family peptidyl-prolyl cis-trans isomerase